MASPARRYLPLVAGLVAFLLTCGTLTVAAQIVIGLAVDINLALGFLSLAAAAVVSLRVARWVAGLVRARLTAPPRG